MREEKLKEKEQEEQALLKKEREAKFQEEIKIRNTELLRQQKKTGGPSLREREAMKKDEEERA